MAQNPRAVIIVVRADTQFTTRFQRAADPVQIIWPDKAPLVMAGFGPRVREQDKHPR